MKSFHFKNAMVHFRLMQKIENAVKKEKKVFNHIFIHCRIMSEISEIFKFFIEGVCTSLLGISGIIGNVVSIAVLSSSELDMMPSFRHLLKMLAAFDATFLIFTLALFGISPWSSHYDQFIKPWLIPYFLPIIQVKSNFRTKNHFWELRRRRRCVFGTWWEKFHLRNCASFYHQFFDGNTFISTPTRSLPRDSFKFQIIPKRNSKENEALYEPFIRSRSLVISTEVLFFVTYEIYFWFLLLAK